MTNLANLAKTWLLFTKKSSLKDIRRIYIQYIFGEYPSNLTFRIYIQYNSNLTLALSCAFAAKSLCLSISGHRTWQNVSLLITLTRWPLTVRGWDLVWDEAARDRMCFVWSDELREELGGDYHDISQSEASIAGHVINFDQSEARRRGSSFQELRCGGSFMGILSCDWSMITTKCSDWLIIANSIHIAFYGLTCLKTPPFLRIFSHLPSLIITLIITLIIRKCCEDSSLCHHPAPDTCPGCQQSWS